MTNYRRREDGRLEIEQCGDQHRGYKRTPLWDEEEQVLEANLERYWENVKEKKKQ